MRQLATTMNQLQSTDSEHLPSQTIANPKGNPKPKLVNTESESEADLIMQQLARAVPLPFPTQTTFQKVEINIPPLEAIKKIPKYAKFLNEICIHRRKKLKGGIEMGRIALALIKSEQVAIVTQPAMPVKCRDPSIFSIPCTINDYTFANAMLDLSASINVMLSSIYNDLEPMGIIIQLVNKSIAHPLSMLEDVLVQINELIFPIDFYVLDMEDEPSGKGFTLIFGIPFLMTTRTKIDVHAKTLSMEFSDNKV
ncbi:hypothetical protein CR513_03032, partial [Mucuna pruriens]